MKVRLLLNKGGRDTKKPKPFIFHERDDTLGICPIAQFIALALADDAFEAENLKTPEEILGVRVALPRNTIQLKWKKSMLDTPIFRRAVRYADGIRTSSDKALPYDSVAKYVKRLGRSAGFYQSFSPYCIRRGIANALDSVATAAERNLILGHSRSGIFEQYYLTQKRDVQSAYIGCPSKDALIRTMGQMSLDRDPRAPKTLTLDQSASIESHPEVKRLQQQKNQLYADLKTTYGKICKAKGTGVYRTYTNLLSDLRCARQARRTALMEEVIEEWHDSIHTKEVEKQAFGASVTEAEAYQIEPIIHTFEERSRLAEVLFRYLADEKKPECSARDLRAISIRDMTTLCALQEVPRREKSSFRGIVEAEEDTPEPDLFPTICPGTQCLFCLGNNQLSHIARTFSFSRLDVLQKHVESVHLWYITLDQKVPCPHPSCENVLDNLEHFLNHAQRVHNNKLASDNYFRQKSY
ncbi:MAG: hypothetical protein M1840_006997 [Geoglossum simile]|nr:MAG: hypothetical protein M1840_006997 [Geoglossum simile]